MSEEYNLTLNSEIDQLFSAVAKDSILSAFMMMWKMRVMCGCVIGDDGWRQAMWWGKRAMGERDLLSSTSVKF